MPQPELLNEVVGVLTAAGFEYMVTGSLASSLQGEPRSAHDIDLVVSLPPGAAQHLLAAFPPPDYYLSEQAILEAQRRRSMFNLLRLTDGERVDFWMLTDEPFDRSRFARRCTGKLLGCTFQVSAPEDTILAKLRWAKLSGGSEKQFGDARGVYEIQARTLDLDYLTHWARQLGVEDLWQRVQSESQPV